MRTLQLSLLPLFLLAVPAAAPAQQVTGATVWQIGTFDHSSAEFHGNAGDKPIAIDANAADAAAQWDASQAGSRNVKAGSKPHPRVVRFQMSAPPKGLYALEFSVLAGSPRVPKLELELNGKPGTVYLNRRLTYFAEGRVDSPINGEAHEVVHVPAALLRQGQNELRITAVDDSDDVTGDSEIDWDALRMVQVDPRGTVAQLQAHVDPTYFYVNEGGALKEIVTVTAVLPAPVSQGSLTLHASQAEFSAQLAPGRFGEQRFEFAVPEFTSGAKAEVTVALDGKQSRISFDLTPRRKFTVMMVPHNHLDIGYTDYQPKIEELQNRNFDRLVEVMRKDPTMRYSVDGVWLVEQYLRTRTPEAQKEFLDQVRAGHISVPAQYANLMAGGADLETLVRSLYPGQALNRMAGQNADYANITDVPAYPWGYASVLHAAGVKYFAAGANDDRGPQPLYGRWQTRSPFWWQGPDGEKVLMAYTRQYSQVWFVCGLPPQEAGCRDGLPTLFQTYEAPGYVPSTLLMYGSQLENTDLTLGEGPFVQRWNSKYAWPHLELATFRDYFQRVERESGDKLETVRGDFGPYWEDGIGTDAMFAAIYRQTESRAAAVETLSSFATLLQPQYAPPLDRLRRLWNDLVLYAEHTYTSWGGYARPDSEESVRQLETKHFDVTDAREQAHWIANESMSRLLDGIDVAAPALVVFNSLGHERDSLVEFDLDSGLELVEAASGKPVALETVHTGSGYQHVRFLAEHVPALGYRAYLLKPESKPADANPAAVPANSVENEYYRVTVDPARGAVSSVFDKQLKRELVDPKSPYLLNQYLYVTGGADTRLIYMRDHLPLAQLKVNTAQGPAKVTLRKTPWGQVLSVAYAGPHAHSIVTDIRLFDRAKQIEFVNRVAKDPSSDKEAIYFAFPIQAPNPQFEYEGQAGTVNPARDALAGANREWFTVGRWARVSGGGVSAAVLPLDGPLATFGDIDRGRWPKTFEPASATIFAYALNNYWHTNFQRVQSGEFTFRYMLTSGADLSPAALSRLGREALTPLESGQLVANDKVGVRGTLPTGGAAFLGVEGDGVEVETLKPAEDGRGYVVRLLETSGQAHRVRLHSGLFEIERLWMADAVENERSEIGVSSGGGEVALPANGIVTLRALLRPASH
jgi:hypothetical protein